MTATVPYRYPTGPVARFRVGPFRAARDAEQAATGPDEAYRLENVHLEDTETLGPLVRGRPGFVVMGAQLGGAGARTVQRVVQFTKRAGTEYTVGIVGGKFYTYDWGGGAWTEVLDSTDFSGASITLSTTARVYCVTFADQLVVTDGVNTAFAWDGTTHGGLTKLTNAPVFYGQPVVYYAKLFGIKNTARQTIVWSEEGQPNTGYEAGGYNNAWDLIQTRTEGLEALAATNDALYFARTNSVSAVTGAVTTDFKSTGTREAVADGIGTRSPAAFIVVGDVVVFPDQYARLTVAKLGLGAKEVGLGASTTLRDSPAAQRANIVAVDDPENDLVRFAVPESGQTYASIVVNLHRSGLTLESMDRGYRCSTLDLVKDGSKVPTLVHGGGASATTAVAAGYVYRRGHPGGSIWNDGFVDGAAAVQHVVESGYLGRDQATEKAYTRGEALVLVDTAFTGAQLTFTTPAGVSAPLTLATIAAAGGRLGTFVLGTDTLAVSAGERKLSWRMRQRGRWLRVRLSHATLGERFALSEMGVEATAVSRRMGVG